MTPHTITLDGALFQCPACAWRTVLTTDNRVMQVEKVEDAGHDHIGQARAIRDERRAHITRTMDRLRMLYTERATFDGETMSRTLLQRLFRAVLTEHGYMERVR